MGYVTREVEGGSTALSSIYPSYYRELQIHNWTPVDIVITDNTGKQETLLKWPRLDTVTTPYVEIEYRYHSGARTKVDRNKRHIEQPIPTKKFTVNYQDFVLYPIRVEELGIIVSTVEQSLLAKNMILESGYSPECQETYSDCETVDPRFVFEVKDPFNRWECLYLNVLGQTITLRCGHSNQILADIDEAEVASMASECKLSCYLRYPTNYMQAENTTVSVFSLNLATLDEEQPYTLPSGDVICIASSMDALQRVIAKRHSGVPGIQIAGMISKEVHDNTVAQLKSQLQAEKDANLTNLRSLRAQKDTEISDLKNKLNEEKRKTESQARQLEYWDSLHESSMERYAREDKLSAQREKSRQESLDHAREDTEAFWTAIKVGGTVATAVLSFALTVLLKTSSKK